MRIVSLLPSLTELVCALGRGADLVGVTHECDYPPDVVAPLPRLTRSRIAADAPSAAIDAMVAEQGGHLYDLDAYRLAALRPELILTQTQCDVCAVNETTVRRSAAGLPGPPQVESVNPTSLDEVFAMFRRVGTLLDVRRAADDLIEGFATTVATIARRREGRARPRTLLLEWTDPPFIAGHWNPELIALAGGREVLGRPGEPSRRATWDEVRAAEPDVILLSPCGFSLERTEAELPILEARPEWANLPAVRRGRVVLVDGSSYFSRPGPRLEASLRIASAAIDPDRCGDLAPPEGWRRAIASHPPVNPSPNSSS